MKAIVYDFSVPKYVAAKGLGRYFPSLYYGKPSALKLKEVQPPSLPGLRWIKVKPILAGICGTDMGAIFYKSSPALTPFTSFPSILGHEVVGIVTATGPAVTRVKPGDRIAIDPFISCTVREIDDPCPACQAGLHCLCRHSGSSAGLAPGMIMGFCRDLPGAWAEAFVAHESMAIPVPEQLSDRLAVLIEPLSVGLHAVLRHPPQAGERVLVIGGGMMAFAVVAALRLLDIPCHVTHYCRRTFQKEMSLKLGTDKVVQNKKELEEDLLTIPSTGKYQPLIGPSVYTGGYDVVYDCVGTRQTLHDAIHVTRDRGQIVLVGAAGTVPALDWTFVWAKELSIHGSLGYGKEKWQGEELSTHELLIRLLLKHPGYPLEDLVTHEFPLEAYQEAIKANADRGAYQSVKTVFRIFDPSVPE
ncbi:Alcohol dehydrogenase GroES domain protein [Caldalkalibacillus thermarum TA2.A1]|uniref:Alcohol dehydrogenase GroES domain protein n=1 Tax=Caldalkalibacillus thermarum (strain TA2.A1) TaxID=986075 RepID=F5L6W0_CALTT|nr:L-threonine dehydrogenase [Caldalkalibacillus thermarum]EGL82946.1 Alcohol dehydrogenase GroES domain protein [Caldalkalibacillus thermarum TA2.A1]